MNKLIHFLWPTLLLTGCVKPKDFDGTWSKHNVFDKYSISVVREYDLFEEKGQCRLKSSASIKLPYDEEFVFESPESGIEITKDYDFILYSFGDYFHPIMAIKPNIKTNFKIRLDGSKARFVLYDNVKPNTLGRYRIPREEWMNHSTLWVKGKGSDRRTGRVIPVDLQIDLYELRSAIESIEQCRKFNSLVTSDSVGS